MNQAEVLRIRKALKMTQAEFAALVWVHPQTVSKWELGTRSIGRLMQAHIQTVTKKELTRANR